MKFRRFVSNFDYVIFISTILITIIGILFIYSANLNKTEELQAQFYKQIIYAIISLGALILILFIPEKDIQNTVLFFYLVCLFFLIITLFFPEIKGQRRIKIFLFSIQFSEIMKIASILFLSIFYANKSKEEIKKLKVYLQGSLIIIIPVFLILLQPDLGTLLVFFPILLSVSFIAGVNFKYLIYTIFLFFVISLIPVITSINKLFFNNENAILTLFTNTRYVVIIYTCLSFVLILSSLCYFNIIKGINEKFRIVFYWIIFFISIVYIGLMISYPVDKYLLKEYQKDRLMIFLIQTQIQKAEGTT